MTTYADPTEDYQTIDRLNARIEELEAALRPLADEYLDFMNDDDYWEDFGCRPVDGDLITLRVGILRQAAEALKGSPQ